MTKEMPIIVSHYTVDTGYEVEVNNLINSLKKYNLEYDIEAIKTLGSWRKNSNYCSTSIKKMLDKYPNKNILRVDADAVFVQYPALFLQDNFNDVDVAAHIANFRWHPNELLGGTIFFRNTPEVKKLVDMWDYYCNTQRPNERNPDLLQETINKWQSNIVFNSLPAGYCCIFDIMRDEPHKVIVHNQASRRFKKDVNIKGLKK